VDDDPQKLESWNIQGWKQHTSSRLVVSSKSFSIQQIGSITAVAAEELGAALSARISVFMHALDQSVNGQYGHLQCSWQSAYNFFTPDDEKIRLYRRQAKQTFPLFVQQLFLSPKDELTASIIKAIDTGVPLVDFMATLLHCPKKCIRHLNGLGIEDIGTQWAGRIKELVIILGGLDVNRLPKSKHEWEVFGDTINVLYKMTRMPTTALSSRMLLGELSKLNWSRRLDVSASFDERALVIERFAENVRSAIIATAWLDGREANQDGGAVLRLATEAACSLGLSHLEKLSRKWRAEENRLDSMPSNVSKNSFPVILEEPLELGELKILQLTNAIQLAIEGRRMSNCVGGFIGQCSSGRAFIFSIRGKLNEPGVTIEYQLQRSSTGLPELLLVQQRGFENSSPDSKYHNALHLLNRFTQSPLIRKKLLDVLIYRKAVTRAGDDLAAKYIRSLEFIKFLEQEVAGRFDFRKLAEEAVRQ